VGCSLEKFRRFRRAYRLHLQGRKIRPSQKSTEARDKQNAPLAACFCWFLVWRRYVLPKRRFFSNNTEDGNHHSHCCEYLRSDNVAVHFILLRLKYFFWFGIAVSYKPASQIPLLSFKHKSFFSSQVEYYLLTYLRS
jgi:hypothetical protein